MHIHLKNVLTDQECDALIARGDAVGWTPAAVNSYGTQVMLPRVRNNDRVEFDDTDLAKALQERLLDVLGDQFPHSLGAGTKFQVDFQEAGSHFRMYRYVPGQYFKCHKDGSHQIGELESEITVLFYLNDADGGETVLYPHGPQQADWSQQVITPRKGDVLMFNHNTWHEGKPVNSGEKIVLRTDLFYKPNSVKTA